MSARSTGTDREVSRRDVVLQLDTVDDLFTPDDRRMLDGSGRLRSGLDELADRFLAERKVRHRQRIVIDLADTDGRPDAAAAVERAVRRYLELRIDDARRQRALMWRQGTGSLWTGFSLFFVGVLLSYAFTRPDVDDFTQDLLGNGVFLVVAWVGLWFPLDLLFISRQPLRREIRVLERMIDLPVLVRTPR